MPRVLLRRPPMVVQRHNTRERRSSFQGEHAAVLRFFTVQYPPKEELAKRSIPCTVNAPGVGRNFMDHLVSQSSTSFPYTMADTELPKDRLHVLRNQIRPHKRPPHLPRQQLRQNLPRVENPKNRLLLHLPFGAFAFARLDTRLEHEHLWQNAPAETPRASRCIAKHSNSSRQNAMADQSSTTNSPSTTSTSSR